MLIRHFLRAEFLSNTCTCLPFTSSGILKKSQKELTGPESTEFISRFRDRFSAGDSYVVSTEGSGFSQLSVSAGQANAFPNSFATAGAYGLMTAVVWLGLLFMRAFQHWALSSGLDAIRH